MAKRSQAKKGKRAQYVRAKKRKDDSSALARRSVTIVVLLLLLCAVGIGLFRGFGWIGRKLYAENPRFEIQHLVISNDGSLREDLIREYTGLREGMNLFSFDFEEVEESLTKVPVVESVYLERKLPNALVVKVKERVPVARVEGREKRRYPFRLDRFGHVMPAKKSAGGLPLLEGLDLDVRPGNSLEHPDVETVLKIIALCDSHASLRRYVRIESLNVKYADYIDMRLQDGLRVRMPRHSLNAKLQKLAATLKISKGQGRRLREVDLTLDTPNVPATPYRSAE